MPPVALAAGGKAGLRAATLAAAVVASLAVVVKVSSDEDLQRADWREAAAALGPPYHARAVVVRPAYATTALEVYGHRLEELTPGTRVREVVFIGSEVVPTAPDPAGADGLALVEQRRVNGVGLLRYRSKEPLELTPAVLARSPKPIRLELSQSGGRWVRQYLDLGRAWRRDLEAGDSDPAASLRLRGAPAGARHLPPPPEELPQAARLLRHAKRTALIAREYALSSDSGDAARLRRALDQMGAPG